MVTNQRVSRAMFARGIRRGLHSGSFRFGSEPAKPRVNARRREVSPSASCVLPSFLRAFAPLAADLLLSFSRQRATNILQQRRRFASQPGPPAANSQIPRPCIDTELTRQAIGQRNCTETASLVGHCGGTEDQRRPDEFPVRSRQSRRCFFQSMTAAIGCNRARWIGSRPRAGRK